ncbi:DUF2075 domain-containing protein [Haloplasma contractile]|uniref:ATP-GTP binding protein n=1 Tax=Haloplasma contractile SSD-17B TaxID=1033810 RepID=F7PTV5_9MOLU|nr:DUF2075 domain-containing protein [Haloplasma contractile]ERJ12274.1 ATP-GTP binding protein [Haloplasma contractile SSD-17B]
MNKIKTYKFEEDTIKNIEKFKQGKNWPVVYILEDGKEAYVGETINAFNRSKEHYKNSDRKKLNNIHIISDNEFNKSATLDLESSLIEYMSADGIFKLQNSNKGLINHNYYEREKYQAKLEILWDQLKDKNLAKNSLIQIRNFDLFKFSPYKSLSLDQESTANAIIGVIDLQENSTHLISGGPGTGKTILALYLVKLMKSLDNTKNLEVGLVIPMTSLRQTLKRVFKSINGLKAKMVIGPSDVVKQKYDVLIVDEAHRLKRRKNITNYGSFDNNNRKLGINIHEGTELDWIQLQSDHQILFYDQNQSVKPSDIPQERFSQLKEQYGTIEHFLSSQMRVLGGEDYINYIDNILNFNQTEFETFNDYDVKLYKDIKVMHNDIKELEKQYGLCRLVAGIAWEWKKDDSEYDFIINGVKLKWNTEAKDWVNSENSINEVGCIHTIQGYDLNYAGVIIGPELSYDKHNNKLVIHEEKYLDTKGKSAIEDKSELVAYIKNIYKTLLTRGIKGTYIYVVDEDLRDYLSSFFEIV